MPENSEEQPVKLTITHYRKPQHTHEAFINWMVESHLRVAIPVFKKHGLISYHLFVTPPAMNLSLKEEMAPIKPSWDFAGYDCVIEYIVPSFQIMRNIMSDPGWQESLKDQDDWVDGPKALLSIGHSIPYLLNGEAVNLPV
ncbi:hypothetical protein N7468_005848 [Penicillium chermesinum]|uniref:EthD domain-containing protein n=1 Tax=Penicillium chermesinum TaxID=63820 RepID=A0A9W9P032_9EURO|nr:uncharacterized protein N7468_005848 [Penicillium chermesinum]KAJ5232892.1 hypothetical protein N7468_005848 [Penicillium chermesinum]KAJ6172545.1 hypothetical protein N7470_001612 [Penicillium chermesinum]